VPNPSAVVPSKLSASAIRSRRALLLALALFLGGTLFVGVPVTGAAALVIAPTADGYVDSGSPATSYGSASRLKIRGWPTGRQQHIYLSFTLTGVGSVSDAKLRLFGVDASDAGGTLYTVADTSWNEPGLTWNTRPSPGIAVATLGPVSASRWVEVDVSAVVTGPGSYAFMLQQGSNDPAGYHSRQATRPPLLVVTHAAATPSPSPSDLPMETPLQSPMETPSQPPSEAPSQSEAPSESPSEAASQPEAPSQSPSEAPSESPSGAPSDSPSEAPSQSPSEATLQSPSPTPVETPPETPTATPATPPGNDTTSANRETCTGYPEPRVFLESQDWWQPIPGVEPSTQGHVHLGMCFPVGQTVSGVVEFDIRIVLHDNLGVITRVKMQDDQSHDHLIDIMNISAPASGELIHWHHVAIDTTRMTDGNRLFRWYVDLLHANGNRQTARTGWPLRVENGLADVNAANSTLQKFSGWYQEGDGTEWGYTNADIGPVPTAPISATWRPTIQVSNSGGPGVTSYRVALDPDFHAGNPGATVASGVGAFKGPVSIDPSVLTPGRHRLVVITTSTIADEEHSGVGVVPFVVAGP
jgi:hypothetical protein